MKLGADSIYIELAGEAFELRPSLRAGMRLMRRHGFFNLLAAVEGFDVSIVMDVLREAAIKPSLLLAEIAAIGLGPVYNRLAGPLVEFILALAGHDQADTAPAIPASGKPADPEQVFTNLFEVATGWLGWAPKEAWNATPAEIHAAHAGRTNLILDVLKVVFGTADEKTSVDTYTSDQLDKIEEQGRDPAFDRKRLQSLKNRGHAA